jgi:NNP family nitrate/nitrite transporter-like MFS transporter
MSLPVFVAITVVLGFVMSLGKAAVYKHIPVYYPHHVGAVGGLVGMIGGLGGFFLPVAFGMLLDATGVWTAPFMLLFAIVAISTVWMHVVIRKMEHRRHPALADEIYLSDLPDRPLDAPVSPTGSNPVSTSTATGRPTAR